MKLKKCIRFLNRKLQASSFKLQENGFTLIELIISLGIIIVLVLSVIFIVNPANQLAKGRNQERQADLNSILNAVGQNIFDNSGTFSCASGAIPTTTTRMATSTGNYDIGLCLIPNYLANLPTDPSTSGVKYISETDYNTGYFIVQSTTTGRVTVSAPAAELGETVEVTR